MTLQTTQPLEHLNLNVSDREAAGLARELADGLMTVDLPYQRGPVWTAIQRIELVKSWMTGTSIPAIIRNDRDNPQWENNNGPVTGDEPFYAVIDGKQRLLTANAWFSGGYMVPASWFQPEYLSMTHETSDGPYVRYTGLTAAGRRIFARNAHFPVATAKVGSIEAEAAIYLRVNGGGTPQTDADMTRAAAIARQEH